MPQPPQLDPSEYGADGNPVGILLIHGFTGSVAETRPLGEYLARQGFSVRCPLLPGHGTTAKDLTPIHRQHWIDEVEAKLQDLEASCDTVFVGGLSLGSLLTLHLGASHPEIAGLIPMAPAVKTRNRLLPLALGLRYLFPHLPFSSGDNDLRDPEAIHRIWCYEEDPLWGVGELYLLQRQVRRALSQIRQPLLIFQGRYDAKLHPGAAQMMLARTASTDKTMVWLENSGHNLLADGERAAVWAKCHEWIVSRIPPVPQQGA
jgi:carboxylesterase